MGGRIRTAKDNKDAILDEQKDMTLDTDLLLPKIQATKTLEPYIPEGWIAGDCEYEHNFGYPPTYLYYTEEDDGSGGKRYSWNAEGEFNRMNSTRFLGEGEENNTHLIIFLDPLSTPMVEIEPTEHDWGRIRVGADIGNQPDYETRVDTKYQTLKVYMQGEISCSIPAWTPDVNEIVDIRTDWFSVEHNLGYAPIYTPFGIPKSGLNINNVYDGAVLGDIPTNIQINEANDLSVEKWAYFVYQFNPYREYVYINVDTNKYYLGYERFFNNPGGDPPTFPARTVSVRYTLFANPINEDFEIT